MLLNMFNKFWATFHFLSQHLLTLYCRLSEWFWSLNRKCIYSRKLGTSALGWLTGLCLDLYSSVSEPICHSGLAFAPGNLIKRVPPLLRHSSLEQWVLRFRPSSVFSGHGSSSTGLFGSKVHHQFHGTIALSWIGRPKSLAFKNYNPNWKEKHHVIPAPNLGKLGRNRWLSRGPAHSSSSQPCPALRKLQTTQCASLASTRASYTFQKKVYLPNSLPLSLHALEALPLLSSSWEGGRKHTWPSTSINKYFGHYPLLFGIIPCF